MNLLSVLTIALAVSASQFLPLSARAQPPPGEDARPRTQEECNQFREDERKRLEKAGVKNARAAVAKEDDGVCGLADAVRRNLEAMRTPQQRAFAEEAKRLRAEAEARMATARRNEGTKDGKTK